MRYIKLLKYGIKYFFGYKVQGIGLILTRRCNLVCRYCKIRRDDPLLEKQELTVAQWKLIIDKFIQHKHSHFIFTGGEPLFYDGVYELIDYTSKLALTSLITNTSFLNEENFMKLENLDFLTFSFDSLGAANCLVKDCSDKLEMISKYAKQNNITVSAIITITSKNCHEVESIIKKLHGYKISVLLSLIHSGQGDYDFRNYTPELAFRREEDFADLNNLQAKLLAMKKKGYKIAEREVFIKNMIKYVKGEYQISCPATNPFFTIDFDGRIKACHDTKASVVNALEFQDYKIMKAQVAKTINLNCNCYYDCYFNSQHNKASLVDCLLLR